MTTKDTEIIELQEQLQAVTEKLKIANEEKSSFMFNMSHDIRTSLNAMMGFASLAKKSVDNPGRVQECLDKIEMAGELLLRILNDILDMTRIECGKVYLNQRSCNMANGIEKVDAFIRRETDAKGLYFYAKAEGLTPIRVFCDPMKINQVIMNLLSNAIKFTNPGGQVRLTFKQLPCSRRGYARFIWQVSDTGIGMAPDFLRQIFEPFERENVSSEDSSQGTGLSMTITKKLVDMMGGNIAIESEQGKGTKVSVMMDLPICEEEKPARVDMNPGYGSDFTGRRILVAEDNELNRELAEELLTGVGFEVETAEDGAIAVEKLATAGPGYYDLILMDIQMPYMDGYMATQAIRRMDDPWLAGIPIVAMTANAFEKDKQKAMEMEMNDYLAKPIDMSQLLIVLKNILLNDE